jgi:H/ACA ribonucleoprotein complex subunit 4
MNTEEILEASTGLAATLVRVMMEAGTYPRGWTKKEGNVKL